MCKVAIRQIMLFAIIIIVAGIECLSPAHSQVTNQHLEPLVQTFDVHDTNRFKGENTTLVVDFSGPIPRHDATYYGKTTISLLSKEQAVLFKREIDNSKFVGLGYSRARHAFVLESIGEIVSTPGIDAVIYVPEDKPAIVSSKFNSSHVALTVIPSRDLRFVVFVGRRRSTELEAEQPVQMYVLDTQSDTIHVLGKPPAPPPWNKDQWYEGNLWSWYMAGICDLEPNVCQFTSPHVLRVTYGRDDFKHRAKNRSVRIWNLDALQK